MTVVFVMGGLAVALGIVQILLLWAVCRLLGAQCATILRAAGVFFTTFLAYWALLIVVYFVDAPALQILILVVGGLGLVISNVWLIKTWLQLSKWRSVAAWLLSGIAYSLIGAGISYGVRQTLAEAFKLPTNSMAPAILGRHQRGECPECNGPLIVSVQDRDPIDFDREEIYLGICLDCQQAGEVSQVASKVLTGDRVITDKTTSPRRWDVIVFRPPVDSDGPYAKRLVGLPGETIEFRNETVYIDGQPVQLPDDISNLHYYPKEAVGQSASDDEPRKLRSDEFFVLGDNSKSSNDSRYFGPIKSSDIIGVVTVTYWPPARWRIWR